MRNQTLDESGATFDATFGTGVQEDLQTRSTYALAAAQQSHAHHIRVFCSTWAPESISDLAEATTAARSQLNQWILKRWFEAGAYEKRDERRCASS